MPIVDSGRHVCAGEIHVLMARVALHAVLAVSGRASLDVLEMNVTVVSLQWRVARGMTIHAARMHQHRVCGGERLAGSGIIFRGGRNSRQQKSGNERDPLHKTSSTLSPLQREWANGGSAFPSRRKSCRRRSRYFFECLARHRPQRYPARAVEWLSVLRHQRVLPQPDAQFAGGIAKSSRL